MPNYTIRYEINGMLYEEMIYGINPVFAEVAYDNQRSKKTY